MQIVNSLTHQSQGKCPAWGVTICTSGLYNEVSNRYRLTPAPLSTRQVPGMGLTICTSGLYNKVSNRCRLTPAPLKSLTDAD